MNKILLLVVLFAATLASRHIAFDDDEFQHAHMAWLLARGEIPHRDFFEHHLPLYHLVMAPLTLGDAGPSRILLLRFVSCLWLTGSLALFARFLQQRLGSLPRAPLLWLLLSPIFFVKMIEVRPESFAMFLAAAALVLLGRERPSLLFAGLLAGATVMASQKFIFLAFGLFCFTGFEHRLRGLLRFSIGGVLAGLPILAFYLLNDAGPAAWEQLVVLNRHWKESFSPAMYASLLWNSSPVLVALAVAGLAAAPAQRRNQRAAALLLGAGLAAVLIVPIPFRQTFLMLYPGLLLSAALGWNTLAVAIPSRSARVVLALAACLPGLHSLRQDFRETLHEDMALMRHLDTHTRGPVFDGRGLVFWRPHVGYYPWMHEGLMMMLYPETYSTQTQDALRDAGFPKVLWDYRVNDLLPESLTTFLAAHYVPSEPSPLWVPGLRIDRSRLSPGGNEILLPVAGTYRITWRGGSMSLDGQEIDSGVRSALGSGPHRIQARGFVRDLRFERVEEGP